MWLKNPATALTETSILFTVRNPDERTDRLIPVYPLKHLSCGSIKRKKNIGIRDTTETNLKL